MFHLQTIISRPRALYSVGRFMEGRSRKSALEHQVLGGGGLFWRRGVVESDALEAEERH